MTRWRWVLLLLTAPGAAAEEPKEPAVGWAMAAGLATAILPLAVGGGIVATRFSIDEQHAGILTLSAGLALAPIVSHAVTREWKRAAIWGAVPVVSAIGMAVFLAIAPDVVTALGEREQRIPFAALLILSLFSSAGGLADTFSAGERWRKVHLVPIVSAQGASLAMGGSW